MKKLKVISVDKYLEGEISVDDLIRSEHFNIAEIERLLERRLQIVRRQKRS